MSAEHTTRREVLKKAVYLAPVIVTLAAHPGFANKGSGYSKKDKEWKDDKSSFKYEDKAWKENKYFKNHDKKNKDD